MSARNGGIENFTQIAPEEASLREPVAFPAFELVTVREMIGLSGDGAHAIGGNIEKVGGLGRRICYPSTHAATAVDQDRVYGASSELRGEDRS